MRLINKILFALLLPALVISGCKKDTTANVSKAVKVSFPEITLNGSSLALPRILACLLENNQNDNGIVLPVPLQSYFGSEMI